MRTCVSESFDADAASGFRGTESCLETPFYVLIFLARSELRILKLCM